MAEVEQSRTYLWAGRWEHHLPSPFPPAPVTVVVSLRLARVVVDGRVEP